MNNQPKRNPILVLIGGIVTGGSILLLMLGFVRLQSMGSQLTRTFGGADGLGYGLLGLGVLGSLVGVAILILGLTTSFSPQPPPTVSGPPTSEERTIATLAHVITLVSSFIGPLVIYLVKKDESAFVGEQAKEVLNFHLSVLIYAAVTFVSCFLLVGFLLVPALGIFVLVVTIMGALSAYEGKNFRDPLCIRFL